MNAPLITGPKTAIRSRWWPPTLSIASARRIAQASTPTVPIPASARRRLGDDSATNTKVAGMVVLAAASVKPAPPSTALRSGSLASQPDEGVERLRVGQRVARGRLLRRRAHEDP